MKSGWSVESTWPCHEKPPPSSPIKTFTEKELHNQPSRISPTEINGTPFPSEYSEALRRVPKGPVLIDAILFTDLMSQSSGITPTCVLLYPLWIFASLMPDSKHPRQPSSHKGCAGQQPRRWSRRDRSDSRAQSSPTRRVAPLLCNSS